MAGVRRKRKSGACATAGHTLMCYQCVEGALAAGQQCFSLSNTP